MTLGRLRMVWGGCWDDVGWRGACCLILIPLSSFHNFYFVSFHIMHACMQAFILPMFLIKKNVTCTLRFDFHFHFHFLFEPTCLQVRMHVCMKRSMYIHTILQSYLHS